MNELANELIKEIMLLGEKAAVPTSRSPGQVWKTKGGFGAMNPSKNIQYFTDRKTAQAYADGRIKGNTEKPVVKGKKAGSAGTDAEREKAQQQTATAPGGEQLTILPISSKSQQAGLGKLHTDFDRLIQSNNPAELTAFMEKYGIVFDERKNTFYVLSVKGREQKKIFGDGSKSEAKGAQQRELFDKLKAMGVDVHLRDTYIDPLKPEGIVPKSQQREFDGKREGDIITFDGQQYRLIPTGQPFKDLITQQTAEWRKNFEQQNGRKPTRKETDAASRQFVILADAMNKRYRILEKLLTRSGKNPTPHKIAVFDGEEGAKQYVDNVRQSLLRRIPEEDTETRKQVEERLKAVEDAQGEEQSVKALVDLYHFIEKSDTFVASVASVSESLSIMLELKRGRKVVVPMSDNFKAADLISLSEDDQRDPTQLSLEELTDRVKVVYSSVSVKREEGAASSMIEKFRMSVFSPDHQKTLSQLEELSSGYSKLFSDNADERGQKEQAIRQVVGENFELIKKYYNLPNVKNADELLKILGNGGVECKEGETVARPTPSYMQNEGVNQRAYRMTHLMQFCAEAIANTRVISQGFGNHFWGGRQGFTEIDGITRQVKQESEPNKRQRGVGPRQMPDYMVSHNVIPTSEQDLRSGDPCR